jgi:hypothetical protein
MPCITIPAGRAKISKGLNDENNIECVSDGAWPHEYCGGEDPDDELDED